MKPNATAWNETIGDFFRRNFPILLYYLFLLGLYGYLHIRKDGSLVFVEGFFIKGILMDFPVATGLMILHGLLLSTRGLAGRLAAGCLTALLNLIVLSQTWLKLMLHTGWSDRLIRVVADTNYREFIEFSNVGLLTPRSIGVILAYLSISWIAYDLIRLIGRRYAYLWQKDFRLSLIVIVVIAAANLGAFVMRSTADTATLSRSIGQLGQVVRAYGETADWTAQMKEAVSSADGEMAPGKDHPMRIVWVIGESDSPYHSSLYGYDKPTLPRLMQEDREGNILTFQDVVCYMPLTGPTINSLYSPALYTDSDSARYSTPTLPVLFRKAGYAVRLFDNQSTLNKGDGVYEIGWQPFLNSYQLSKANFDYRNDELYYFDGQLLDAEEKRLREARPYTLDILHLYGQHIEFKHRFPRSRAKFRAGDYSDRSDLSERERQTIADYDNAVLYMDGNLGRIIDMIKDEDAVMVYVSDHGELVCEEDNKFGRNYWEHCDRRYMPHYMSVAMYVYTTPRFRTTHPDLYRRLTSASTQKFSTLYFSHFLLDLGGIKSRFQRPDLSPLSDRWSSPPRPIWTGDEYDEWLRR